MTPDSQAKAWPIWLKLLLVAAVAVALAVPVILWKDELWRVFASREQVAAEIRGAGAWGPILIIGLAIAQTVVAPIPGQAINFVSGYVYGPWLGLLYSWLGLILGSAIAMLLARYAGRPLIEKLALASTLDRIDRIAAGKGLGFFFLFFLVPGLPDDLLCFVAGLTTLPLRILLPMAAIARLPGLLGSVWLGASAERIPPVVWVVLTIIGLLIVALIWRYGDQVQDFVLRRLGGHEGPAEPEQHM
jgi:uncharacterized membrane protein YdjX (TVP38/TMEM64 family)